jgi:hypothetical protein
MAWTIKEKLLRSGGEMKKVAGACKPPVVIPFIVVLVDIHVPLIIPAIERSYFVQDTFCSTIYRRLVSISRLNFIRHLNAVISHTKYLHFL